MTLMLIRCIRSHNFQVDAGFLKVVVLWAQLCMLSEMTVRCDSAICDRRKEMTAAYGNCGLPLINYSVTQKSTTASELFIPSQRLTLKICCLTLL